MLAPCLQFARALEEWHMKKLFVSLPICLVVGMAGTAFGQPAAKDIHDQIEQTTKASQVLARGDERTRQGDSEGDSLQR